MNMAEFGTGLFDALKASSRNAREYRRAKVFVRATVAAGDAEVAVHILNISQSGALLQFRDEILKFRNGHLIVDGFDREIVARRFRDRLVHVRFAVPFEGDAFRESALPLLKALAMRSGTDSPAPPAA
jgi:hypothetical protein